MAYLDLYIVTFNCARTLIDPTTLSQSLLAAYPSKDGFPDVVFFSLQEFTPIAYSFLGGSFLNQYYDRVIHTLQLAASARGGDNDTYNLVATHNLGMTAGALFIRQNKMKRISHINVAGTGVGLWDMGNKGAVGMNVKIHDDHSDTTPLGITFVAAHLAPMEDAWQRRNQDWQNIVRNLVFVNSGRERYRTNEGTKPNNSEEEAEPLLTSNLNDDEDVSRKEISLYEPKMLVFCAGDFNYRTKDNAPSPDAYLAFPQPNDHISSSRHYLKWKSGDQLQRELRAEKTFQGFLEQEIHFPPTYKYSHKATKPQHRMDNLSVETSSGESQGHIWAWAKHRFPSWCDRCLYLPAPSNIALFQFHRYTSLPIQYTSDHQPVCLSLTIRQPDHVNAATSGESADGALMPNTGVKAPFSINPNWRQRNIAARRKELIAGLILLLVTTKEGIVTILAGGISSALIWYIISRLGS
jgi:hypothetical protein